MDNIEFYDVRKREKVSVPVSQVKKTKYVRTAKDGSEQVRYAVKAEVNGSSLTKFVSEETWRSLSVAEV